MNMNIKFGWVIIIITVSESNNFYQFLVNVRITSNVNFVKHL